ncbi:hypothetical protein HMPREF9628_01055 [Peptoanaerobacter stomatis]|uniref:Uncharacterized protein n=1 Tax=Peptoanaerobacter stomatis TaxID=796937 RepID=G9XAN8_9FIRM|nr:hypothetical protein [Peptoanaerobacter stomatis]EHL20058.1 hypothetical protein HMPREF9628_01055 [Peptoanaerobacter stomatis]
MGKNVIYIMYQEALGFLSASNLMTMHLLIGGITMRITKKNLKLPWKDFEIFIVILRKMVEKDLNLHE